MMLHDLIKVNLQKEIPLDNVTEHLPNLQSRQYLYPLECQCTSYEHCIHKMQQSNKLDLLSKDLEEINNSDKLE